MIWRGVSDPFRVKYSVKGLYPTMLAVIVTELSLTLSEKLPSAPVIVAAPEGRAVTAANSIGSPVDRSVTLPFIVKAVACINVRHEMIMLDSNLTVSVMMNFYGAKLLSP